MPEYWVTAETHGWSSCVVEADSPEEAIDVAFNEGDWEMDDNIHNRETATAELRKPRG